MKKKKCDKCGLADLIMFRVKINTSKKWVFLCKKCTEYNKKIIITMYTVAPGKVNTKINFRSKKTNSQKGFYF